MSTLTKLFHARSSIYDAEEFCEVFFILLVLIRRQYTCIQKVTIIIFLNIIDFRQILAICYNSYFRASWK